MKKILLLFFIALSFICNSQNTGDVAQNFGATTGFDSSVSAIAIQSDGKILLGGSFDTYNGIDEKRIIRLNPDGTKDTSFNTGTGFSFFVKSLALQTDGKILVGGWFSYYNGITENYIIRLNADGTKDTSFTTGSGFNNVVNSIALQSDGKIIVVGSFTTYNGQAQKYIIRLNNDGTKDTSFNIGSGFTGSSLDSVALQTDGKILLSGYIFSFNGMNVNYLIRLNADGTKDTSFTTGTGFDSVVNSIAVQTDGKILLGGRFGRYNGITKSGIIRLNPNGTDDTSFKTSGEGFNAEVNAIKIQPDAKILVGGNFTKYNGATENRIIRLNADGNKDISFNTGIGFISTVESIALQADGKIIVGGSFTSYNGLAQNMLIRLKDDGTKDTSLRFTSGNGFNISVDCTAVQSDGKILVGGSFSTYNELIENRIIRLNQDGTKDTSFNTGSGFDGLVESIVIQSDGKILVGGWFTSYKGVTENDIIRLNQDGTKDTSFTTGSGFNDSVNSIVLQSDGKILVGGRFTTYNGLTENNIIRLNTNGTKDRTFDTKGGFDDNFSSFNFVLSLALQTDGKILVGGILVSYQGIAQKNMLRLNTDGTIDKTFTTGTGFNNSVESIVMQTDGKILVGGRFTMYRGITENKIIRLNTDGTKDTTFDTKNGFEDNFSTFNFVLSLALQTDGKILVGGGLGSYQGIAQKNITRLNVDGTLDSTFTITGTGFNNSVLSLSILADQKILVGGLFSSYNNNNDSAYLISLYGGSPLSNEDFENPSNFSLFPNPVKNILNIRSLTNESVLALKIYDSQGKLIHENANKSIDVSNFSNGLHIVKIETEKGTLTKKFIKE